METVVSIFSYFVYFSYIALAVWLVQRQAAPGRQYGAAALLALGAVLLWAARPALALIIPLGALAGLVLLAVTAGGNDG